ncbi:MAG: DNA-directed RNA polymerase subunit alpha [Candidatus Levybacteria bacterium RIFCSPHIGHO2_02_FULL_37_13]|nr:MAG: DNA-directed RNA polymerase subunit alpha [Candidatus Levybacteria bacterium RIFCSPHIGHO2_02_FULL_37_13]OGH29810.1 MAG: DNA-directed RNA polymerase subunit alpha [Candidatus Levybacteria bacterium RIFCSPHIGHO2_12_FULL_37_9]OGH39999.1 MAG: DNA-directed RNA polymerase subunit alpha [Candidatus Levybacteria bacterium RIFCSPLOWO2_01_FULL_37_26]
MQNPSFSIKEEKISPTHSEFTIEPLPPGYGHTMGNSLRRTLLTSIEGAAVTSIKISGVKHKFSTVTGLKENVVDLLLNIKGLNIRLLDSKASSVISLSAKGPKELLASDLEVPDDVEIVNKEHYLGFLSDKKAKLDMELTVEKGLGYSLAEDHKASTLGVIPTDAVFTPVRRVNYEISATRVGRQTDLDKLILRVWTNGIVTPREALDEAARILSSYFLQVYEPHSMVSKDNVNASPSISDTTLNLTIDEVDLPTRIYNSLRNGGIETIGALIKTPKKDLLSMRNLGRKSIEVIEEKLKEKGISLME